MRVYLIGFMGSGKSTVGELLARRLSLPFVDLDREIERAAGRSVTEIFAADGETGFRRLEREALARAATGADAVIATGGGLPAAAENRAVMRATGVTVWLDPGIETALARLAGARDRPLLGEPDEARRLYRRRLPAYRECDHRVRPTATEAPGRVAERVAERLRESACAT